MNLEAIIAQYGIWAVALGAGLEGETALVLGGIAVHRELIAYASTILAGAAGSFIADQTFFAIGRKFRDGPRIKRLGRRKDMPARWLHSKDIRRCSFSRFGFFMECAR